MSLLLPPVAHVLAGGRDGTGRRWRLTAFIRIAFMPNSLALQLYSLRHEATTDAEGLVRSVPSLGLMALDGRQIGWSAEQ